MSEQGVCDICERKVGEMALLHGSRGEIHRCADDRACARAALSSTRTQLEAVQAQRDDWENTARAESDEVERQRERRHKAEAQLEAVEKELERVRALKMDDKDAAILRAESAQAESSLAEAREALKETQYRSGIAHATLRDAVYRVADQVERGKMETALDRLAEINSLTRAALHPAQEEERFDNSPWHPDCHKRGCIRMIEGGGERCAGGECAVRQTRPLEQPR